MPVLFRILFLIGDVVLVNLSIFLSYYLNNKNVFGTEFTNSLYLFIFSNLAWLFLVLVSNPYNFTLSEGILHIFKSQMSFFFVHLLIVASLIIFFKKSYSVVQLALMYGWLIPIFFFWKLLILYGYRLFQKNSSSRVNFVIIGKGELSAEIRRYFLIHSNLKYRFRGYIEPKSDINLRDQLRLFCRDNTVNEIFCCVPNIDLKEMKLVVELGLNRLIKVRWLAENQLLKQEPLLLNKNSFVPSMRNDSVPLDNARNRAYKRVFDLIFSSMVIITILSWLIPLIWIIIRFDSPGPLFFKQRRAGRGNKPFYCYKLRTMVVNREADVKQATRDDYRITKVGRVLRRTSLDEIPQFFNVFKGEMSIIGPRPHPYKLNEQFIESIEQLMSRHYVKPGITGLAQCMGYRGETSTFFDMNGRVKLDRFYIENWSFALDIKIIIQTIVSLVRINKKAY
jgi:putative colanic acid biosysnthesis UDP-glucose lipid carrier transferase